MLDQAISFFSLVGSGEWKSAMAGFASSQGHRTFICFDNACYLVNITLAEFERRLDPKRFRRVHRSVIVNLDKIVTCKRIDRRLQIELSDGSRVIASRAGSQDLREHFM